MSRWPLSVEERFWSNVDGGDFTECWTWTGHMLWDGYGNFNVGYDKVRAHRWSYEALIAPIPVGLVIDHLCRNRICVNPWHLEPVTRGVNTRRGETGRHAHEKAVASKACGRGHRWTEENTYIYARTGLRACRACARLRDKARRRAKALTTTPQESP